METEKWEKARKEYELHEHLCRKGIYWDKNTARKADMIALLEEAGVTYDDVMANGPMSQKSKLKIPPKPNMDLDDEEADGEKPDGEKPDGEKPDGEKPDGEKPAGEKPDGEEPAGEKPAGEKPAGEKPDGEKPDGEKPDGENPAGEKPAGEKPGGEKPDGEKPGGEKPPSTDKSKEEDKKALAEKVAQLQPLINSAAQLPGELKNEYLPDIYLETIKKLEPHINSAVKLTAEAQNGQSSKNSKAILEKLTQLEPHINIASKLAEEVRREKSLEPEPFSTREANFFNQNQLYTLLPTLLGAPAKVQASFHHQASLFKARFSNGDLLKLLFYADSVMKLCPGEKANKRIKAFLFNPATEWDTWGMGKIDGADVVEHKMKWEALLAFWQTFEGEPPAAGLGEKESLFLGDPRVLKYLKNLSSADEDAYGSFVTWLARFRARYPQGMVEACFFYDCSLSDFDDKTRPERLSAFYLDPVAVWNDWNWGAAAGQKMAPRVACWDILSVIWDMMGIAISVSKRPALSQYNAAAARRDRPKGYQGEADANKITIIDPKTGKPVEGDIISKHPERKTWLMIVLPSLNPKNPGVSRGVVADGAAYPQELARYETEGANLVLPVSRQPPRCEIERFETNVVWEIPWGKMGHKHVYGSDKADRPFVLWTRGVLAKGTDWTQAGVHEMMEEYKEAAGQGSECAKAVPVPIKLKGLRI